MPRLEEVRSDVQQFLQAVPFEPFVLLLENGQQVSVDHPENIAFDPDLPAGAKGAGRFSVISGDHHIIGNFRAVTSVARRDQDNLAG